MSFFFSVYFRFDTTGSGKMVIQVDGREVALTCIHVGVDLLRVNEILNNKVRMWCIMCNLKGYVLRLCNCLMLS